MTPTTMAVLPAASRSRRVLEEAHELVAKVESEQVCVPSRNERRVDRAPETEWVVPADHPLHCDGNRCCPALLLLLSSAGGLAGLVERKSGTGASCRCTSSHRYLLPRSWPAAPRQRFSPSGQCLARHAMRASRARLQAGRAGRAGLAADARDRPVYQVGCLDGFGGGSSGASEVQRRMILAGAQG